MNRRAAHGPFRDGRGPDAGTDAHVTMYTLSGCPFCVRARRLFDRRGTAYFEICGDGDPRFRAFLRERTGRSTVLQILIGDEPIGGSVELAALDRLGILAPLARGDAFPVATVRRRLSLRCLPATLAAALAGGARGPWLYAVELRDRAGALRERQELASADEAGALARLLNAA